MFMSCFCRVYVVFMRHPQFSMAEGLCAAVEDEFDILRKGNNGLILRAVYCASNFLLGLPMVTEVKTAA